MPRPRCATFTQTRYLPSCAEAHYYYTQICANVKRFLWFQGIYFTVALSAACSAGESPLIISQGKQPAPAQIHRKTAPSRVTDLITNTPDLVGAFITAGDACAAWAAAKKALGKTDLIIVGTDYTDEALTLLENGEIQAFVAQPIYEETQTSVVALDAILRGKDFPGPKGSTTTAAVPPCFSFSSSALRRLSI